MAYQLPPLPYAYNALEPTIDEETMHLHHDKHHQAYVTNLNAAIEKHSDLFSKTPEELIRDLNAVPEDIRVAVRNNAGGDVNHTMFWKIMAPNAGAQPSGQIANVINQAFGSFDAFKQQFADAGLKRFGSGWAWLIRTPEGNYAVTSTPNQDNPMMEGNYPILGNDVWEHAYYLKYQNRRGDYLNAWWNVINWDEVNNRLQAAEQFFQTTGQ